MYPDGMLFAYNVSIRFGGCVVAKQSTGARCAVKNPQQETLPSRARAFGRLIGFSAVDSCGQQGRTMYPDVTTPPQIARPAF
jgi:hypothetical protein